MAFLIYLHSSFPNVRIAHRGKHEFHAKWLYYFIGMD